MKFSARRIGGALVILLVLLLFASAAFGVLAAGAEPSAAGGRLVTILTVLFASGALASFLNLFAARRGLYATATLLLVVLASGALCVLVAALRAPSGPSAAAPGAASCFWLILASALLLVYPLSCAGRKPEEEMLNAPRLLLALIYTGLLASGVTALILFSGPSQAFGRLAARLPLLGLALSAVGLILVILRCRTGAQGLASLLCLSLAPVHLLAAFCLMPGGGPAMAACRYGVHVLWAGAAGCGLALLTADRRYFSPLRSSPVYHLAAAAALSAVILAALGLVGAVARTVGKQEAPDPCPAVHDAGELKLPSAPGGYCPGSLPDPASHFWIGEPGHTRLAALGKKMGPALEEGVRSLAIRVSTPGGAVRAVTLDLAARLAEPGSGECGTIEVLRFPWQPPAEEIDLALTFPLCPGAEMWPDSADECRKVVIGRAPPEHATGGGGCKSPSRFTLLPLSLGPDGPRLAVDGKEAAAALPGIASIEAEIRNRYTIGQRIGSALVLVVDPEKGGTLQDLVDLITLLRWRNVPVVDLLWIKGWETSGEP